MTRNKFNPDGPTFTPLASPIPTQTRAEKGMLRLQSHGHFAAHAQRPLSLHKPINHLLSSAAAELTGPNKPASPTYLKNKEQSI